MKRSAKKFSVMELAVVGFIFLSVSQPVIAGNKSKVSTLGNGWVYSDLVYSTKAFSQNSNQVAIVKPASAVNYRATLTYAPSTDPNVNNAIATDLPSGAITAGATAFLSQVTTVNAAGWKALAKTSIAFPATAANEDLEAELKNRGFKLEGAKCGAKYEIASGGEVIGGKKFLVVYGSASEGTAAWFQGFTPEGKKLYDVLITGPFDFGSTHCTALKIPFEYSGFIYNVDFLADTIAVTASDLQITGCESPISLECGQPLTYGSIDTTGKCGTEAVKYSFDPALGTIAGTDKLPMGSTTKATVTATDGAGNVATCTIEVTVAEDKTPPTLQDQGADRTIEFPASPDGLFKAPTATDNCDSNPKVTFVDTRNNSCSESYSITRTWTAKDSSLNPSQPLSQTISVVDTTAPSLLGVPDHVTVSCESVPGVANVTATDTCDPSPAVNLVSTSNKGADPSKRDYYNYTITRTWTAKDACGNQSASKTQTITIQDTTPPVAPSSLPNVTLQCLASSALTPPTATDNCATPVTGTTAAQDFSQPGTYTITWTFTDPSGNSSTTAQVITTVVSFNGFSSPLNGMDTSDVPCPPSLKTIKLGSKIPIKFSTSCSGSAFSSGLPTFEITKCDGQNPTLVGVCQYVAGEWHANWDSSQVNQGAGRYVIRVKLQDGTFRHATITLK